jgi:orotate phosphoribosyltransferase
VPLSLRRNLRLCLIREAPKTHGKGGFIDGYVPTEQDRLVLVDGVFTAGSSFRKILVALTPTKANVLGCYAVVKRREGELPVPVYHLFTAEDLF